jgi:hypothetical protein
MISNQGQVPLDLSQKSSRFSMKSPTNEPPSATANDLNVILKKIANNNTNKPKHENKSSRASNVEYKQYSDDYEQHHHDQDMSGTADDNEINEDGIEEAVASLTDSKAKKFDQEY